MYQVDLPRYSSKEVLRQKLLYAIANCRAIDADREAANEAWNEDDE